MAQKTLISDIHKIDLKLKRMAFQIWEQNSKEKEITLIGIEGSGVVVMKALATHLREETPLKIQEMTVTINKKAPLKQPVELDTDLTGKSIVVIDDVANSGRTLLYAIKPLLNYDVKKILIAVLVNRTHKSFPVSPDIVGHTVATTLQDRIEVECKGENIKGIYLL